MHMKCTKLTGKEKLLNMSHQALSADLPTFTLLKKRIYAILVSCFEIYGVKDAADFH